MEKLICTLEFKEGRPVAKTVNGLGKKPTEFDSHCLIEHWRLAENSRREFEISQFPLLFPLVESVKEVENEVIVTYKPAGTKFTATIENNIVTKIELL